MITFRSFIESFQDTQNEIETFAKWLKAHIEDYAMDYRDRAVPWKLRHADTVYEVAAKFLRSGLHVNAKLDVQNKPVYISEIGSQNVTKVETNDVSFTADHRSKEKKLVLEGTQKSKYGDIELWGLVAPDKKVDTKGILIDDDELIKFLEEHCTFTDYYNIFTLNFVDYIKKLIDSGASELRNIDKKLSSILNVIKTVGKGDIIDENQKITYLGFLLSIGFTKSYIEWLDRQMKNRDYDFSVEKFIIEMLRVHELVGDL